MKKKYIRESKYNINNLKSKNKMGKLIKGIKIAAWVAEIIVASSVIVEFAEKYGSKKKKEDAAGKVGTDNVATENQ